MPDGERRLAAIMYTDIVGYTALTQKDESSTLQALERHRSLLRPIFSSHGGREIKTIGDAFLVEFQSALDAVLCAIAVQQMMHDRKVARGEQLSLRIGIHVGDVVESGSDILGDAVNIASRIYPLAEPGGVCISEEVQRQVGNKLDLPLVSLGAKSLKNVGRPVEVYRVIMPWERQSATKEEAVLPRDRIAILPFVNYSPDPEDEYFANGMTEEVISTVSGITGLSVISRTSVMGYKGTTKRIDEIGRELRVGSVLEGSFRKAGNKIRVTTQLIDVASDKHLWAQNYDRDLSDVFAVQSDVAKQVADALRVRVPYKERERIDRRPTESVEAHSLYLKGVYHLSKQLGTASDVTKSIEYFQLACEQDPAFALAYARLAECYVLVADMTMPSKEAMPKAKEYASRALTLDDTLAEAHYAQAMIANQYDWDWAEAERGFKEALSLNPSLVEAHCNYTWFLAMMGRSKEVVSESAITCELDPMSPLVFQGLGIDNWIVGEYGRARALLDRAIELAPSFVWGHLTLALLSVTEGKFEEAVKEADQAVKLSDDAYLREFQAQVYAMTGLKERARELLDSLLSKKFPGYLSPAMIGTIYYLIGEKDRGWEWMQKAYEARDTCLAMWNRNPTMKAAREDPRFVELLGKMKLV